MKCEEEDPDQAQDTSAVGNGQIDIGAEAGPGVDHTDEEDVRQDAEEEGEAVKDNFRCSHTAAEHMTGQVLKNLDIKDLRGSTCAANLSTRCKVIALDQIVCPCIIIG